MIRTVVLGMIRGYQLIISPLLPGRCRFYPTCSEYTLEAVKTYGVVRGGWLGARRIVKCGPWHKGGYDPLVSKEK